MTTIERFWKKTKTDGHCLIWGGYVHKNGYGIVNWKGKTARAHRVSWEISFGEIPPTMFVCHKCDNPPCVNPQHLFLGTARDNTSDMILKGRARWTGPKRPHTKLTNADVAVIMSEYSKKKRNSRVLAERFGVHPGHICNILKGLRNSNNRANLAPVQP